MDRNFNTNSKKYLVAKESLPKELQDTYTKMIDAYSFYTLKRYGRPYVAYDILADMVRDGWAQGLPKKTPQKANVKDF